MQLEERRSKRHCMVVLAYYPLGETRVQREAEALVARGYEVHVISLRGSKDAPNGCFNGVQIHRVPLSMDKKDLRSTLFNYLQFFFLASLELARQQSSARYDSVQVHNLPDFLAFCALIPKLQGTPVILDLHDLMPEFYSGRSSAESFPRWALSLVRLQERLACRFADHVITVSEHWRQALIQRGVPPEKCSVVMNVADEKVFQPQGRLSPKKETNEFRLLYHGTLVYRYGLDLAIQAVDMLKQDIPNIHLTILGDGSSVPDLNNLIKTLGLEHYVTLQQDFVPVEELPAIIKSADLGIVPYRNDVFTDGLLPTKLMEYLAMSLPAVASRTTAIQSYFDSAVEFFEPGNVSDLAQTILALYKSPQRLKELSQSSQIFQERYNWTKIGAEYVALVERLNSRQTAVYANGS